MAPWLPTKGLAMVHPLTGLGKTPLAIALACANATGKSFLIWQAPKARRVLYVDGEMPAQECSSGSERTAKA